MSRLDLLLLSEEDLLPEEDRFPNLATEILASPRAFHLPHEMHLGAALLASVVRERGYAVEVLDNFLHLPRQADRLNRLLRARPRTVGLCTTFIFFKETILNVVETVRSLSPESTVILGGQSLLSCPEWRRLGDIAVPGEGETALPLLLETLKRGGDLSRVPGIEYREGDAWRATPAGALLRAEAYPRIRWDLLDRMGRAHHLIETQRGCPFQCAFCTNPVYRPGRPDGSGLRMRPVSAVLDEFRRNYEEYGITGYWIVDSTFTSPRRRTIELCSGMVRLGLPLRWTCYARVDDLTPELASLMREAGCRSVFLGIESGDDRLLKEMDKEFTVEDVRRGVRCARDAGLYTIGSFVLGYPGETERSLENTERLIRELKLTFLRLQPLWLDHNAPVWRRREEYGLTGEGNRWRHATMDSVRAEEFTRHLLRKALLGNWARPASRFMVGLMMNLGLDYDEALRLILAKGLLAAYRYARSEGGALDAFDPAEIRRAWEDYLRFSVKAADLGRSFWAPDPDPFPGRERPCI